MQDIPEHIQKKIKEEVKKAVSWLPKLKKHKKALELMAAFGYDLGVNEPNLSTAFRKNQKSYDKSK
jgi:hypothetical protein